MIFTKTSSRCQRHCGKVRSVADQAIEVIEANRDAGYHYHAPGKGLIDKTVFRDHDMVSRLGEIICPTLILQGTIDAVLPPDSVEFLSSQVAGFHLVFLEDAGHLIDTDQPERWLQVIRDFITQGREFHLN